MPRKKRTTEDKIIQAAWKLFHQNGYEETTVDEIIAASGTSKGSFYYYFRSKEALLNTLSAFFDEQYREISEKMDSALSARDKLLRANHALFHMIETEIDIQLLASLYASQLTTESDRSLLDHKRYYFSWLRETISAGLKSGEFANTSTLLELVHLYALYERAMIYDWVLYGGSYSLTDYSAMLLPLLLERFQRGISKDSMSV